MELVNSIGFKKECYLFKLKYKTNQTKKLKIFGKYFIMKNKLSCKMIYKNKTYKLQEYLDDIDTNYQTKNFISIKLRLMNNYFNASTMFEKCDSLISISMNEANNFYIINMRRLFYEYNSLESIPDISDFDTTYVVNINGLFCGCCSIEYLPDISNWNTKNVTDMNRLFYGCNSLKSLPDISKWNTSNVNDMGGLFFECNSLKSLPDISKWNTNKLNNVINMFYQCNSLESLPDLSKWNISHVQNLSCLFF